MSWIPLDAADAAALLRAANTIIATFQGRSQSRPIADFDTSITDVSLQIQFTDNSSSPFGSITSWLWDFGDGTTSTSQSPLHTFPADDSYLVSLTVLDSTGRSAQVFQLTIASVIEVPTDPTGLTAKFSSSTAGLVATFTDLSTSSDSTVVGWFWQWGEQPTANFSSSVSGLTATFTDTSTAVSPNTLTGWSWNFGDGSTSTAQNPVHTYATGGNYNVTLTVSDNQGQTNTTTSQVTVSGGNTAGLPCYCFAIFSSATSSGTLLDGGAAGMNGVIMGNTPASVIGWMTNVKNNGMSVVLFLAGGSHDNYKTNGVFDINKWFAVIDTYATSAIKSAIETRIADGTVLGNALIDEPENVDWGPAGSITKAMLDSMADYIHTKISPNLAAGVNFGTTGYLWRTNERFKKVDYCSHQMSWPGTPLTPAQWRDAILAQSALDGVKTGFGINLFRGEDFVGCDPSPSPAPGRCIPTAAEILDAGSAFVGHGISMEYWRYNATIWGYADRLAALQTVSASCVGLNRPSWLRP